MSVALDSLGYHKDMEACLQYFIEHQSGVGSHGKDIGPEGDVKSTRGCFVGTPFGWMCNTGVVLSPMAGHYRYSRNAAWLRAARPSILAAWDWIQKEREATRTFAADGKKVAHYGLLPKGRAHDWPGHRYHYCFSDAFTYKGMAEMAVAFREAGMPEAERFSKDAQEYRQCILDAMHQAEFTDPDTGLLFVPNTVYFRENQRGGIWRLDGPICLFAANLLDPVADAKYWDSMLAMVQRHHGTLGGLMACMGDDSDPRLRAANANALQHWYCNATESTYYRGFLARGESEKALLVFYTNLLYGMSEDLYQTVERVNTTDSDFAPYQPNASGNARILQMMRRMVIDEQDEAKGMLWLLRGCPRRWFAAGKSVVVADAPTLFGKMAMHTTSTTDAITIDIDPPADRPLRQLCVVMRHPDRQKPREITLNGANIAIHGEVLTIPAPVGHLRIVARFVP